MNAEESLTIPTTVEAPSRTGMLNAQDVLRPVTGDRRSRVRSTTRSSDRKSTNANLEETIPERSVCSCSKEREGKMESDETKAEPEDNGLPLLKGTANLSKIGR